MAPVKERADFVIDTSAPPPPNCGELLRLFGQEGEKGDDEQRHPSASSTPSP